MTEQSEPDRIWARAQELSERLLRGAYEQGREQGLRDAAEIAEGFVVYFRACGASRNDLRFGSSAGGAGRVAQAIRLRQSAPLPEDAEPPTAAPQPDAASAAVPDTPEPTTPLSGQHTRSAREWLWPDRAAGG